MKNRKKDHFNTVNKLAKNIEELVHLNSEYAWLENDIECDYTEFLNITGHSLYK